MYVLQSAGSFVDEVFAFAGTIGMTGNNDFGEGGSKCTVGIIKIHRDLTI